MRNTFQRSKKSALLEVTIPNMWAEQHIEIKEIAQGQEATR